MRGRRSGVVAAKASHLLVRGRRRRGVARERSEPLVAVSGMPLHELLMLAKDGWPNVEKTITCIRSKFGAVILTCLAIHKNKILDM
jgi:hypothetical protein